MASRPSQRKPIYGGAASTTTSDDLKPWFPGVPASSYRAMSPSVAAAPVFFFGEPSDEKHHHFLDSCFLCKNRLADGRDIFMYRGDTPFCSEECRQEQIDIDEALEKLTLSSSRNKQQHKTVAESPPVSPEVQFRAAGAAVAG